MERQVQAATVPVLSLVERPAWALCDLASHHQSLPDPWRMLSEEERQRAQRFHFERDRLRWIRARAWMRHHLGVILGCPGSALQFHFGAYGKPYLAGSGLQFNLAHSGDLALLAWSWKSPVGVDLEWIQEAFEWEEVARNAFSEKEYEALLALPASARRDRFYDIWTAKEAYVKGLGCGIGFGTKGFSVWPAVKLPEDWCIDSLPMEGPFRASLAWRTRGDV